ncbi:MAG: hypothetical protein IT261_12445 [Saprospiraceae bacterium]|nr:hypothetical protein [Saprospiraceae bacterium]
MKVHLTYCLLSIIAVLTGACDKQSFGSDIPDPKLPTTPIYVPIYSPGDTSKGAAYANKLTHAWKASVFCKTAFLDSTKISLQFFTYTAQGFIRERIGIGSALKVGGEGEYRFHTDIYTTPPESKVSPSYSTWQSDGDVTEDSYRVDSTDVLNRLVITKIDLPNKRVEGTFHASFNIKEPRINVINPKKVTFSEGRFWATIRD